MLISDIAIRRPVFTTMVVIGLMTLGILGASSLGVDLFPDIDFPAVGITTVYPGAGPEEVEQLVSKPLEEATSSINGIDEVRSYSRDSISTLILLFKLETDAKSAATDVREKVAAIRSTLPKDIKEPVIMRYDPSAMSILTFAVSSKRGPAETRRLTEDVIQPRIEAVEGVASVTVSGGLERELHIYVDRERLEALGLSLAQVAQQIGADSFDLPGGRVTQGASELNVRTLGRFRSIEELQKVAVASLADGSQVLLSDVAQIEDGFKEVRSKPVSDGEQAVVFEIQKQSGSNTVAVADAVYKRLKEIESSLPSDVKVVNLIDTSTYIRRNIADVRESILWGGLMAILVIFVFMLDWRSTVISSLALPTSIVTTFLAMWIMGFNFNMMTMMALSLAIGLLIDDAVVVRENIFRHMERGEDPITAARKGTAQIGLAVMATTFTIVAVFIPVAFTGGMAGKFFRQFGLTVAAAVIVSLLISFTLDPMLSARVVKPIKPGHHKELEQHRIFGPIVRAYDALDAYYRKMLAWALGHKKTVIFSALGLFLGAFLLVPLMGSEFMNNGDRGEFALNLEAPAGTAFARMEQITAEAEKAVRKCSHVRSIFSTIAPNEEANKASLRVYTDSRQERPGVTIIAIEQEIRGYLAGIPSLRFQISEPQMGGSGFSGGMDFPIFLQVRGENYETLQHVAQQTLNIVRSTKGTVDADMSYRPGKPETSIHVDRARAADLGVSVGLIAQTVRTALEGDVVAKYRQGDRDWDIRLQLSPEDRKDTSVIGDLVVPVTSRKLNAPQSSARHVRINEVAQVSGSTGPTTIERFARQRQILITAGLAGRSLGEVKAEIEQKLAKLEKPAGYTFEFGGQAKRMGETFVNLGIAMLVAILFIYFVLASQFESFIHPLTIMVALPLALIGAIVLLFLGGYPISMISLIGVILLMGLVTKNSILLVDLTNELRMRGKGMVEALLEAGPTRLRPILMTSAAMVLGMLPSALSRGEGSEARAPMALAVIGGVITSTFLTLIVVPVVYTWMDRFSRKQKSSATRDVYKEEIEALGVEMPIPEEKVTSISAKAIQREA
jgi:hydrophobe/amphiphile efflux-1 (HAE1) family protein